MIKRYLRKFKYWLLNEREIFKNREKCVFNGTNITVKNTVFEGHNMIAEGSSVVNCEVGLGSYINHNSRLIRSKIGRYCSIADNVYSGFGHHPLNTISTHSAFFYDTSNQLGWSLFQEGEAPNYDPFRHPEGENKYSTLIGNDVWIGSHVLIMDRVRIGNGAVVGAGSVVVKDVPPYAIVAGVPAKIIRFRHDNETISDIEKIKWWNNDIEWLKRNIKSFRIDELGFLLSKR